MLTVAIVTPKFYSKHQEVQCTDEDISIQIAKLVVLGPREKYGKAQTENQKLESDLQFSCDETNHFCPIKDRLQNMKCNVFFRYGWYQVQLCDTDKTDRRLHFAKRTNQLIFDHLMTFEKIRK